MRASCIAGRPRRAKPFVKVNAAALPSELLESELFGHERGAFTGAQAARIGKFEFANHGTLMLDEIGEMPAGLQAKLLHVLQDSEFTKLGSNRPVTVDVRIIAATNRDLEAMMRAGSFREDLYYRLQVIELFVPPLRERREEIPQLIEFFLVKYSERYGRPLRRPSDTLRETLLELCVARQRARAGERDQAVRHPAGRRPGAGRTEARTRERRVEHSAARAGAGGDDRSGQRPALTPARRRQRPRRLARRRPADPEPDDDASEPVPTNGRQPARARTRGRNARRTRGHSTGARSIPLESSKGRGLSRRQLQDPAEQDERVRDQRTGVRQLLRRPFHGWVTGWPLQRHYSYRLAHFRRSHRCEILARALLPVRQLRSIAACTLDPPSALPGVRPGSAPPYRPG